MSEKREPLLPVPDPGNQNAQLVELSLRLQEEIGKREHAEKISRTIFNIAANVNQVANLDALYRSIHQSLSNIIDVTNFFIALYDKDKDTLSFPYFVDEKNSVEAGRIEYVSESKLLSAEVIRNGKPLLIRKENIVKHFLKWEGFYAGTPAEIWLGVPLKLKGKITGVISTQSYRDPLHYTEKDLEILLSVSDQVAIAIDRKRADEEAQRRAVQADLLYVVGERVSSRIEMEDLLSSVVNNIQDAFNYSCVLVTFLDKKTQSLILHAVAGEYTDIFKKGDSIKLGQGLIGRAAASGQTQLSGDVRKNPHYTRAADEDTKSELAVPLKRGHDVIGVLDIQSDKYDTFDTMAVSVLETLSTQIASAIANAQLFAEAQSRAERLTVINRIGKAAATAHNLDKLMGAIYEEINLIFKPDSFFIAFLDQATKELEFRFLIIDGKQEPITKKPWGNGLSSKIITEKQAIIIHNYDQERAHFPIQYLIGNEKTAQSWIGVPLFFEDQIIGVVSLSSYKPNTWNQEDLQLFFTMVDQISAVIAKARLYESVQQELNERKKAEEAKKDLENRLRQAQKMEAIGTLAGGIAHDFNNVLYPIIGFAEMTMDIVPEEGEVRKNLNEILVAAERARALVQQILTFSRLQEIKPRPLQIQPLLEEALKLIRSTTPSSISMIQNIDEGCGPVLADPSQIHQIIMNLCTNAYHAMRKQGGVLEISLAEVQMESGKSERAFQCEPGLYLCLTVRDTGHGIEPKIIDRIFDPYFTTKPPGEGTGMGLAMVHGIVKSYGGEIAVFSQPEQGTIFKIFLPRLQEKIIETEILEKKTGPGQGERVLFIDDEEQVVRMVKQMLDRLGYEAVVKKDSTEALEEFRRHPDDYDLVITDQTMPNITGLDLSRKLLKIRADIPIILCTGFSEIINEEQAQAAGIRKFIMKPIAKKALAQIIRETLGESYSSTLMQREHDRIKMEKIKK